MDRIRTNIEIDETVLCVVMDRYKLKTKTAAVDMALHYLAGQPRMGKEEALSLEGANLIGEIPRDAWPEYLLDDGE